MKDIFQSTLSKVLSPLRFVSYTVDLWDLSRLLTLVAGYNSSMLCLSKLETILQECNIGWVAYRSKGREYRNWDKGINTPCVAFGEITKNFP